MAFGWAGSAAGASNALQDLLARAFAEQQARQRMALQQQELEQRKRESEADITDRAQQRKMQSAQIRASLLQPGPIGAADTEALSGTPFEALLERKQMLPSSSIAATGLPMQADAGGQDYATLRPTAAQMAQSREREGQRVVGELFQRGAPRRQILGALAQSGQDITGALLNDPEATAAANRAATDERARADRETRLLIAGMANQGRSETTALRNDLTQMRIDAEKEKLDTARKERETKAAGVASSRATVRDLAQGLIDDPALNEITGSIEGRRPAFWKQPNTDALARLTRLVNSLSLAERDKMKGQGQISDFEGRMLASAVSSINRGAGPDIVRGHLRDIVNAFQGDAPNAGRRSTDVTPAASTGRRYYDAQGNPVTR